MKEDFYYKPKYANVKLEDCIDTTAYESAIKDLNEDKSMTLTELNCLKLLATRQLVFKYDKLADYYAQADDTMRVHLEKLHAVIVDTDKAMQRGYFKYFNDYNKLISEIVDEK